MKVHKLEMGEVLPYARCGYIPTIGNDRAIGEFEWKHVTCKRCLRKRKEKSNGRERGERNN